MSKGKRKRLIILGLIILILLVPFLIGNFINPNTDKYEINYWDGSDNYSNPIEQWLLGISILVLPILLIGLIISVIYTILYFVQDFRKI